MGLESRLQTAIELAHLAGPIILGHLGHPDKVEFKADKSPVTAADKQINDLVGRTLRDQFPEDGFLGEEGSHGSGRERYQWICDPIDGTKAFMLGLPNCVFMLGLAESGDMQLSVVFDPHARRLYRAVRGSGAFCNDQPIHVSNDKINEGFALLGTESLPYASALRAATRGIEPLPGTGFKCTMLARGAGHCFISRRGDFHDLGPGSLIVEEAGGKVTGLRGEKLKFNRPIGDGIILSNGVCHDDLIKIIG